MEMNSMPLEPTGEQLVAIQRRAELFRLSGSHLGPSCLQLLKANASWTYSLHLGQNRTDLCTATAIYILKH